MTMQWPWAVGGGLLLLSLAVSAAPADTNAGQQKSAMCAGCHGPDGNSMIPMYPRLAGQSSNYIAKELRDFKGGQRKDPIMSGMAAGLSDQDIANVAAYYASIAPKSGNAAADAETLKLGRKIYRGGNAKTGIAACMSCHGPGGHGIPPRFPRVAGQHPAYTEKQLMAFKNASRSNDDGIMTRIAFRMSEAEIKAVSQYMAGRLD